MLKINDEYHLQLVLKDTCGMFYTIILIYYDNIYDVTLLIYYDNITLICLIYQCRYDCNNLGGYLLAI